MINPDTTEKEEPEQRGPIPERPVELLDLLNADRFPYAHCAWRVEHFKTMSLLENHYFTEHKVVMQPSRCSPPSVLQTIMEMELQLRPMSDRIPKALCH